MEIAPKNERLIVIRVTEKPSTVECLGGECSWGAQGSTSAESFLQEASTRWVSEGKEFGLLALPLHARFGLTGDWGRGWVSRLEMGPSTLFIFSLPQGPVKRVSLGQTHDLWWSSIATLCGQVSHDLHNFMTAVLGASSLLRRRLPVNDYRLAHVDQLDSAIASARKKFDPLHQIGFATNKRLEPVDLANVCRREVEALKERYPSVDFSLALDLTHAGVFSVEKDVDFVLSSLVDNAVTSQGGSGSVEVEVGVYEIPNTHEKEVRVSVRDFGGGLSPEESEKAFFPFFSGWKERKRGLGLALAGDRVARSNGRLWLESQDVGIKACFAFPFEGKEGRKGGLPISAERGAGTVLLVESEQPLQDLLKRSLEAHGWSVLTARFGRAGIALSHAFPEHLDAALCDLDSMEEPLADWCREIREVHSEIRVLCITSEQSEYNPAWGADLGVQRQQCIKKPFCPQELTALMDWECESKSLSDDS